MCMNIVSYKTKDFKNLQLVMPMVLTLCHIVGLGQWQTLGIFSKIVTKKLKLYKI